MVRLVTASNETWHHGIIAAACDVYEGCRYLEVGVSAGACLAAVAPHTAYALGVDPRPSTRAVDRATVSLKTSDEFFDDLAAGERFDVVFIDGDHAYEQAARDFEHALEHLESGGVIFLHDVYPLSGVDTRPRVACGDVYRLGDDVRGDMRFETFTWSRFPGLMQVRHRGEARDQSSVVEL